MGKGIEISEFLELNEDDQKRLLKENDLIFVEIISTYENVSQDFTYILLDKNEQLTEKYVLYKIFDSLNTEYLPQLIKLSCCQLYCDMLIPLFIRTMGKFYFNIDFNKDDDTKRMYDIRQQYLKEYNN